MGTPVERGAAVNDPVELDRVLDHCKFQSTQSRIAIVKCKANARQRLDTTLTFANLRDCTSRQADGELFERRQRSSCPRTSTRTWIRTRSGSRSLILDTLGAAFPCGFAQPRVERAPDGAVVMIDDIEFGSRDEALGVATAIVRCALELPEMATKRDPGMST